MKDKERALCPQCGVEFTKKRYWQKFCTPKCTENWHKDRRRKALALLDHVESEKPNGSSR
jgi:predicted nucleic acid-binding Zn ribbon protein